MPIRKVKKFGVFFKKTEAEKRAIQNAKDLKSTQESLNRALEMIQELSEQVRNLQGENNEEVSEPSED